MNNYIKNKAFFLFFLTIQISFSHVSKNNIFDHASLLHTINLDSSKKTIALVYYLCARAFSKLRLDQKLLTFYYPCKDYEENYKSIHFLDQAKTEYARTLKKIGIEYTFPYIESHFFDAKAPRFSIEKKSSNLTKETDHPFLRLLALLYHTKVTLYSPSCSCSEQKEELVALQNIFPNISTASLPSDQTTYLASLEIPINQLLLFLSKKNTRETADASYIVSKHLLKNIAILSPSDKIVLSLFADISKQDIEKYKMVLHSNILSFLLDRFMWTAHHLTRCYKELKQICISSNLKGKEEINTFYEDAEKNIFLTYSLLDSFISHSKNSSFISLLKEQKGKYLLLLRGNEALSHLFHTLRIKEESTSLSLSVWPSSLIIEEGSGMTPYKHKQVPNEDSPSTNVLFWCNKGLTLLKSSSACIEKILLLLEKET